MKWIKFSEREPNKTTDTTKNSYCVRSYNRKDAIYFDGDNWLWIGTSDKLSESDIKTIEWLDESPSGSEAWVRQKVLDVIDTVKAQYPTSIFPNAGTSPDSKAAMMARLICDNIKREMEIMFNEEPAPSSTPQSVEGSKMVEIPKPIGEFILAQKDIKFMQFPDGYYYHYSEVCVILNRYGNSLVGDKERECETWKVAHKEASEHFMEMALDFKECESQLLQAQKEVEYWKALAEAAGDYIVSINIDKQEEDIGLYNKWQVLKQQQPIK